ncbi:integrase arm-type DNA-binding domain-containing protein (plasmid) [Pseudomonas marginalis]|jgi:excisionase family DNA binding protein|uniref:integrase arm-type DNA-binding domain-containing protein n=1 Tax=Gammaproteobacteria TaxID=1236 RepID=UPI00191C8322|nr:MULTISPECIES: integrase arm-type DNA-binding domain-containing protein [Enterobacteriaceae]MCI2072366.1 integrase arm-type DNA-binding domain-containing protein [Serratia liquefaciens]
MILLTSRAVDALKPKDQPYKMAIDRGLQLRVAPDGIKTLLVRYTVQGTSSVRQYRLPQDYGNGIGQIKLADARAEAQRIRALARAGVDWPAEEARLQAEAQARETRACADEATFAEALRAYVKEKRRAKDGLPLKARTKAEYTNMVEPGKVGKNGRKFADGGLVALADTPLPEITAKDIRDVYSSLLTRSKRLADYAMQILRAVLRWHGVHIPNSPLSQETAGRDRIVMAPARGNPKPIPMERLGAWWLAACACPQRVAANYYRFQLLTGCRGVEIRGDKRYDYVPLKVGDVNLKSGRVLLRDTKNRSDHLLLLSREALAIAEDACKGRKPDEPLFPIVDARKTLAWINKQADTTVQGHGLRSTFTSIAEELVSGGVLKRIINHAVNNDVTLGHYVGKGEAQLRAGWQTVADFIAKAASEEMARLAVPDSVLATAAAPDNGSAAQEQALKALRQAFNRRFAPAPDPDPVLTTEEAARLVGVSRPYMVKLIDSGAVALHMMAGNRRRVRRSAVIRWHEAERTRQIKALKHLSNGLDEEALSPEPLPA